MNKSIWLILLVIVAVLVGVVVFSPQDTPDTPPLAPIAPQTAVVPTLPPVAPAVVTPTTSPKTQTTPSPSKPQVQQYPEHTPEPQQPPRESPTATRFLLCEHIISGVTQYGFSGEIRLINKGNKSVYGWLVTWEYDDDSMIVDAQDVALSGNNPYTGEYLDWNAEIKPGEQVVFSFNGLKGGDGAPTGVSISGDNCM